MIGGQLEAFDAPDVLTTTLSKAMEEGRTDSSGRLQSPLLIDMGLYVCSHLVR